MGVKGFNDNFFHRQQLIWLCNSLLQQCNDVMLMCYLSTITKGANSLNEVSWKISLDYVTSCSICQFLGIYWKSRCQEQKKKAVCWETALYNPQNFFYALKLILLPNLSSQYQKTLSYRNCITWAEIQAFLSE